MRNISLDQEGQKIVIKDRNENGQFAQPVEVDINDIIKLISSDKESNDNQEIDM